MVKTLKGVEDKLRSLITNMTGNDEVMMSYCLELNDDLMKVKYIFKNRPSNVMRLLKNTASLIPSKWNNLHSQTNPHNNQYNKLLPSFNRKIVKT